MDSCKLQVAAVTTVDDVIRFCFLVSTRDSHFGDCWDCTKSL